jgi:(R,R)-butanediol dehydrogenase/meso-butanediol dehydrogenase/diacetyl reductase
VPQPAPGELLLEVAAAGVCGTDAAEYAHGPSMFPVHERHPVTGHLGPLIPGHEFGGTIVGMGPEVAGFRVGDVVASGAGISCGNCPQCRAGVTNVCRRYATVGLSRPGALAEYVITPADICVEVGSLGLTVDTASLIQPMAIAHHAFWRGQPGDGQPVVIVGVGGIGTFLTYVAATAGSEVIALDLDPERLAIARSLGAARALDPSRQDLEGMVGDLDQVPVVYEATGTGAGFDSAWKMLPRGGRLVAVGIQKGPHPVDLPGLTVGEREVIGTNAHAAAVDLPAAARLVAGRRPGWCDIAPQVFPLETLVEEALEPMAQGRPRRVKTLFDPVATVPRPLRD